MTIFTSARRASLGLALAVSLTMPAAAGDWNNGAGSVKDYGGSGGVPVPAPVPVPEYAAQWYFRGDIGVGFGARPSTSYTGTPFGRNGGGTLDAPGLDVGPGRTFGYNDGGNNNEVVWNSYSDEREFSPSYMFGVGVGRYVTDRFRIDITGEYRGDHDAEVDGNYSYTPHSTAACGLWCPDATRRIDGNIADRTRIRSGLFMLNGYWDLLQRGHLTPYVGAGIGFSLNENERNINGSEQDCDVASGACTTRALLSGGVKSVTTSLAASFMAGVSYNIAANTKLDLNYRYLYVGGYNVNAMINSTSGISTASTLKIGDQHEHQLRAGLRWDIN